MRTHKRKGQKVAIVCIIDNAYNSIKMQDKINVGWTHFTWTRHVISRCDSVVVVDDDDDDDDNNDDDDGDDDDNDDDNDDDDDEAITSPLCHL